ncbi:MAG: hypothetical protein P8X97_07890 [Candidatus Bathyarchaeota archaeon]|jgi:hypothetical protein
MESIIINARINSKKKVEFFHTTESLKPILNKFCEILDINIDSKNNVEIHIDFKDREQLENYHSRNEFSILKGSVMSLCYDVEIKIGDALAS